MCSSKASESVQRLERLKRALRDLGAEAMFIRDTPSIEWLTAFKGVFDEEQAHAAFVSESQASIHTDSRYSTAMEREAQGSPFSVDSQSVSFSQWAKRLWEEASTGPGASLAIEDSILLSQYRGLVAHLGDVANMIETSQLVMGLRSVKDEGEIRLMREAQAITDDAFSHITSFMKPGMTEREVQLELDWHMLRNGADSLAFPTIVACAENGASPHAIVSDKVLEVGQCVVMDFGARKDGYCSDMTRTVFIGKPEGEMLDAWNVLRRANEEVERALSTNMTGREAHELALQVLASGGFEGRMGHGLGHGVGIQIHELPMLSPRNDAHLAEGSVVTVEPGIYIPGKFGMRLEDCGVVTANGFERFTQSTHEMVVI